VICGTAANIYCQAVSFTQKDGGAKLYAGVFNYRTKDYVEINEEFWVFNTCQNYRYFDKDLGYDYDLDSKTKTTMAFAIIAPVIGGVTLFFAYLVSCVTVSEHRWKSIGIIFILTSIFQGITLLILQSSICLNNPVLQVLESERPDIRETFHDECKWEAGFRLNIAAVVFWFFAGFSTFVLPSPVVSRSQPTQTQTVSYQQNADGTVEETNVVVKGAAIDVGNDPTPAEDALEEAK
jgi:hypothetical protein